MRQLVLATHNAGKIRELRTMLSPAGYEVVAVREVLPTLKEPEETGQTFLENARLKSQYYAKATGRPCLADDSGLCVEALQGRPGVYSARYAGIHGDDAANNAKLLTEIRHLPPAMRTAYYACVLVLSFPDGREIVAEGKCHGMIIETPVGTNGFGYDPYFYLPQKGKTMAELTAIEKNTCSHRGIALKKLLQVLV
ncbi:XTP/dITP diphosphatase [Megasphaera lornae]|jgi:hypothetical protein|uniref:dITP/XTP pyrophosphatase n=1 Tax=Megasphaera lornae TaxID=1000568 RepID=D3LSN1_9FIRM|nr:MULTISPECIES: XTP/dITP diphosphatase [Megasphaera]EFD94818.1 non-canonical purine NTP pyrophosphatase, RdgB/HAM1 family [Megasphaera genomosp. type_1 str. 28L]EGL41045.1 non-canonical purine NTP pyrophosphatase, RdgB/HAM1 family [Megasphaera lornae]KXB91275.1 non-canonical purine NTP pyrophosphatase, RdgB/HAM1 family [Veillonellaceae bacterium DNF00751]MUP49492.1 XTP/dITP diphosphatase [Veillonellaceae bacterium M1-70]